MQKIDTTAPARGDTSVYFCHISTHLSALMEKQHDDGSSLGVIKPFQWQQWLFIVSFSDGGGT